MKEPIEILQDAIREYDTLLFSIKVVKRTKLPKLYQLVVANELVRKAKSVEAMLSAGAYGAVDSVARSMLESFADLMNFLRRDDYVVYMQYISNEQQIKTFRSHNDDEKSDYAKAIKERAKQELDKSLDEIIDELKEQSANFKRSMAPLYFAGTGKRKAQSKNRDKVRRKVDTSAMKRFELASLDDEYNTVYRILSSSTHGSVGSLLSGLVADEGILWPPEDRHEPIASVDSVISMVLSSTGRIAKRYRRPLHNVKRIQSRFVEWRNKAIQL